VTGLVEKNGYGYWQKANDRISRCCVLLATLNVLEARKELDEQMAQQIAERFSVLKAQKREEEFIHTFNIPETIEIITDGKFCGVLTGPNAVKKVEMMGLTPAKRYAVNKRNFYFFDLPAMITVDGKTSETDHAIAVKRFDFVNSAYEVIDNGILGTINIHKVNAFYKIKRCGESDRFRFVKNVFGIRI
jgi:hypothetical protein